MTYKNARIKTKSYQFHLNHYGITMKFLVVALLLALTASASAGVHKIIEESKDIVFNDHNDDAFSLANVNETDKENKNQVTNDYIANGTASVHVNEMLEENEGRIANGYNAEDILSAEVKDIHDESEGRITNGYTAYAGQLPYQAFLSIQTNKGYYRCGGSLIGSQWVLTAAHCTINAQSVTVYLGSIQRYYGTAYTVYRNNIIIHRNYNAYYKRNDISLIKIPAVNLNSPYIQPIKLPAISNYYSSYAGENVIASGWGQTSDTNYSGSAYLQWARMQVITNNVCAARFDNIASSHICVATPRGVSTCFGDSGGPMVLENSKVLIGLTAFGPSSCVSGYPTAFTRVTSYLDWIKYFTGISYV